VERAQRVPPPAPTRADLLPPHEITAVGIEMMISEEAEESLRLMTLRPSGELRLEEDDAPMRQAPAPPPPNNTARRDPPPVSAAARVTPPKPAPRPAAPAIAPPSAPPLPVPTPAPVARPRPTTPATASTPTAAIDAFFRGAGLPAQKVDERQAEQI